MIRRALLQQHGNGRLSPEIGSISTTLASRGIPYELFFDKHLHRRRLTLAPDALVAGEIPIVVGALRQLGIEPPPPNDYPPSLTPWLRRRIWTGTVGAIVERLQRGDAAPVFVKPMGRLKRFTGHVMSSWDDLRFLAHASDQMSVFCSEIVTWRSEFRVYVTHGRIVGIRHYRGDRELDIDRAVVEEAVCAFEMSGEAIAGYGIDFGVLDNGETALVEVNEGYGLGSYGLDDAAYTDLVIARWRELARPST